jgi:DNA-binding response OmpR family regulator
LVCRQELSGQRVGGEAMDPPGPGREPVGQALATLRLLLIEQSEALAASLTRGLTKEGFAVAHASTAAAARAELAAEPSAIALLDLDLPDSDMVDFLRWVRASGRQLPLLVLSARGAVPSRVAALDAGADDYLIKPFAFAELMARIRALLRRTLPMRSERGMQFVGPRLRNEDTDVLAAELSVRLSPKERALLEHLVRYQDRVVERAELLSAVFGYAFNPGTNLLDVHMAHLRRKLKASGILIQTLRGVGFRLCSREKSKPGC